MFLRCLYGWVFGALSGFWGLFKVFLGSFLGVFRVFLGFFEDFGGVSRVFRVFLVLF